MALLNIRSNLSALFQRRGTRFEAIDGLRAISILWVFVFHVPFLLGQVLGRHALEQMLVLPEFRWTTQGLAGVDVFFVISGFLIGNLLLEEHESTGEISLSRFYLRRAMRLCPAYFVAASVLLAHSHFIEANPDSPTEYAWTNFLYINNFVPTDKQFMPWTWSLAIEEQFYLLCPALVLLLARTKLNAVGILAGLIALGIGIRYWIVQHNGPVCMTAYPVLDVATHHHWFNTVYDKLHTRYGGLLCGVLAAYVYREKWFDRLFSKTAWAAVASTAAVAYCVWLFTYIKPEQWSNLCDPLFMSTHPTGFSVVIAYFLLLVLSPNPIGKFIGKFLSLSFFFPIAQLSYSVYLLHLMTIFVVIKAWGVSRVPAAGELIGIFVTSTLVTFGAAALMFVFVEKPIMNLRPKHASSGAKTSPVPSRQVI